MSIENPNLLERIKKIEVRLDEIENRILSLETFLNRRPLRPGPPMPPGPTPPGPPKPPEPFRF